jgi:hypothetical protein
LVTKRIMAAVMTRTRAIGPIFVPLLLIVAGIGLLYLNLNGGVIDYGELFGTWWPLILVAIGLDVLLGAGLVWSRPASAERVAIPLEGEADARIRIRFGAGRLRIGPAPAGQLVDGDVAGGARWRRQGGIVEIEPDATAAWFGWGGRTGPNWQLGLAAEIPLDLRIEVGAARVDLDLATLLVRDLDLRTGASDTRLTMPAAAGQTTARIESGMASVMIRVPPGVGARIRSAVGLGVVDVDQSRFRPAASGGWDTADYATAANRLDLDLHGGVGRVTVR